MLYPICAKDMPKGAIILTPFPFTDLSGHKVRPALVLHDQKAGEDCIVAFISSVMRGKTGSYDVPAVPSLRNGLKADSVIKVNKIATLQKKIARGELGILEQSTLAEVDKKLKMLFKIK